MNLLEIRRAEDKLFAAAGMHGAASSPAAKAATRARLIRALRGYYDARKEK